MNLQSFADIMNFLGNNMTEEQAVQLMDKAKRELDRGDIIDLGTYSALNYETPFYGLVSEYKAECGFY